MPSSPRAYRGEYQPKGAATMKKHCAVCGSKEWNYDIDGMCRSCHWAARWIAYRIDAQGVLNGWSSYVWNLAVALAKKYEAHKASSTDEIDSMLILQQKTIDAMASVERSMR
jgi:hypothetical protein